MTGQCRNGGCQRLATVEVTIPGLGVRPLCYHCHQALSTLFGELRPVVVPEWRKRSLARDFTGSVA